MTGGYIETVRADEVRDRDVFSTDGAIVTWVCLLSGGGPADEVSITVMCHGIEKTGYLAPDAPCHLWRQGTRS